MTDYMAEHRHRERLRNLANELSDGTAYLSASFWCEVYRNSKFENQSWRDKVRLPENWF